MFSAASVCAVMLIACFARAAEQVSVDADLPQPFEFDTQALSDLRMHSPFNRFVSLEDAIQLTGVAYIDGKPMATLVNRLTKQRIVVSDEPNALGWTLTDMAISEEPDLTSVRVAIGPEQVTIHYADPRLETAQDKHGKAIAASSHSSGSSSKQLATLARVADGKGPDVASLLGDRGREMLSSLSPENREKLTSLVAASAAKHPERSDADRAALAQKYFSKLQSAQAKIASGVPVKPSKVSKPKTR